MNSFGTELHNFSDKDHLSPKLHFRVLFGTQHAPALAFRSRVNLNDACYSRMVKGVFFWFGSVI